MADSTSVTGSEQLGVSTSPRESAADVTRRQSSVYHHQQVYSTVRSKYLICLEGRNAEKEGKMGKRTKKDGEKRKE